MTHSSTPHAPLGAHASFDFGPAGEPAGFALPASRAPTQNVFVGCRHGQGEPWHVLPFFTPGATGPQPLPKGRYGRFIAWAGDKWMIGPLVFKLCTPFSATTDPADEPFACAPVVCGYLEYDNSHSGDTAELVFGVGGAGQLSGGDAFAGFSFDHSHGFVTAPTPEVQLRRDAALFGTDVGAASALHFTVPPHAKRIYPLVLGFFQPGFHYCRHFPNLTAVLAFGLARHARFLAVADARDAEFMRSSLSVEAKGRAAHNVRAWLAQSRRLLADPAVDPAPLKELCRIVTG